MNTFTTPLQTSRHDADGLDGACRGPLLDAPVTRLPVTRLPVTGRAAYASAAHGLALSFAAPSAADEADDRFALLVVDAEGTEIQRLGPFGEEEVVAVWRDVAARAGLVRMIVREDGIVAPVGAQLGRVMLGRTRMRRRHGSLGARRPRFLARRKTGRLPARPQIHRGESEIIARS